MHPTSFVQYALSGELNEDATHTVSLLIDRARIRYDDHYFDDWDQEQDAEDASPSFDVQHVPRAAEELAGLEGVSMQGFNKAKRPVRDLAAFEFLPALRQLVLEGNEPKSLAPLRHCQQLERLHLGECGLTDLSIVAELPLLNYLNIAHNPVADLSPLEQLPSLRTLTISVDQIPALEALGELPALRRLEFAYDYDKCFESFARFPSMPELRVILGAEVESLEGLERFTKLENLVNCSGSCRSIEPLGELPQLTHANILKCEVSDLWLLAGATNLRSFILLTECEELDPTPLSSLPKLHELSVKCGEGRTSVSGPVEAMLSSWDEEFLAPEPRYTPNSRLEVVDQETFDYFDTEAKYGVADDETNEQMLSSELGWLDERLEEAFPADFGKEDYILPDRWPGGRSRTVVLYSPRAVAAFLEFVTRIQEVLARAKNDWIIYFQSDRFEGGDQDAEDFIVWVYPEKIQCTDEHAPLVRSLLKS